MASRLAPLDSQARRARGQAQNERPMRARNPSLRRSTRIAAVDKKADAVAPDPSVTSRKRRGREDVFPTESPRKRIRTKPTACERRIVEENPIHHWVKSRKWPTQERETTMHRLWSLSEARARKRSLSRKRSNASSHTDPSLTLASGSQQAREQNSAPYKHPMFEEQLRDAGSIMDDHIEGISAKSERLLHTILTHKQPREGHTLFSNDELFKKTCSRVRGANEAKVVRDIAPEIVPSAEIRADRGAKHLEILRETVSAPWINARPFIEPLGSRQGYRPQPDFGLGFKRDAFTSQQLQKLAPLVGDPSVDSSLLTATHNMFLPFLSSEVKCGAAALDVADRQNAYTQSTAIRGLVALFGLAGRQNEVHREITGFSISHNDVDVRIWAHYARIDGENITFYRRVVKQLSTMNADDRFIPSEIVRNIYDLWVPTHFKVICSVIDELQDIRFDVSDLASSAQSQAAHDDGVGDDAQGTESPLADQLRTPEMTDKSSSEHPRKRR